MTNINKMITELEELMAKAEPRPRGFAKRFTTDYWRLIIAMHNALPELLAEIEKLKAYVEQMQAEQDVLAGRMADEFHQRFGGAEDECYPDYYLRWAAQEAAKRGEKV